MTDVKNRDPYSIYFDDASLTQQSFRDDCDVNILMKRFRDQGDLSMLANYDQRTENCFKDVSSVIDYKSALDAVSSIETAFDSLPAIVRSKFDNDPLKFADYCKNPSSYPEFDKDAFFPSQKPEKPTQTVGTRVDEGSPDTPKVDALQQASNEAQN